jgi:hypothetical protein
MTNNTHQNPPNHLPPTTTAPSSTTPTSPTPARTHNPSNDSSHHNLSPTNKAPQPTTPLPRTLNLSRSKRPSSADAPPNADYPVSTPTPPPSSAGVSDLPLPHDETAHKTACQNPHPCHPQTPQAHHTSTTSRAMPCAASPCSSACPRAFGMVCRRYSSVPSAGKGSSGSLSGAARKSSWRYEGRRAVCNRARVRMRDSA